MKRAFTTALLVSAVTGLATACAEDEPGEGGEHEAGASNHGGRGGSGGSASAGEDAGGEAGGTTAGAVGVDGVDGMAGRGGEAGAATAGEEGGAAGISTSGSPGGEGGRGSQQHPPFEYDTTLCDCSLTAEMTAACTLLSTERFLMLADPIRDDCTFGDGIPEIEHLECDDGTLRYEWTESEGVFVRIVLDAESGEPVHLYGTGNYSCFVKMNGSPRNATVTYGTDPQVHCERTFHCCLDGDCGTAGQGGSPG